jgi:predicted permease
MERSPSMETLARDLRHALRQLRKAPLFSSAIILTLALGIGATAAMFSLFDQMLLRPLPVPHPEELVFLNSPGPDSGDFHSSQSTLSVFSEPVYEVIRDRNTVFSGVLAYARAPINVGVAGTTEQAEGVLVSGTFFPTLGLQPAAGRLLSPEDDRTPGGHPVAVLGNRYWKKRFGGDPEVVGRTVLLNGQPMTIVGVAPGPFWGLELDNVDAVYVPLMEFKQIAPVSDFLGKPRSHTLILAARLKDGISRGAAGTQVNVTYRQILAEDLKTVPGPSARFQERFLKRNLELLPGARGASDLRERSRVTLLVLMAMVSLVLLIACGNVANLLLARASSRRKEVVLKLALGASRGRLVAQLLVESLVLSLVGGSIGFGFSPVIARFLIGLLPTEGGSVALSGDVDLRVALFAFVISSLTAVVFGLAPALTATRGELFTTLREEAGNLIGGDPARFRRALVIAEVALSLLLLIGAGLFGKSLENLRRLNPGFRPEKLLTFAMHPDLLGYDTPRSLALVDRVRQDLAAEPGIASVSMADIALMAGDDSSSSITVPGYTPREDETQPNFNDVGPGFFRTLGIPVVTGREVADTDGPKAPAVAVVNETFARYYFKGQDPVGRTFTVGRRPGTEVQIVGLVRDGKSASLREPPLRFVYLALAQRPLIRDVVFYARVGGAVDPLLGRVRAVVRSIEPNMPVVHLQPMEIQIGQSLAVERLTATLAAGFGFLATVLAALGLYGVISYAVSQRTREIGIRLALGAEGARVISLVMAEVGLLTGLGVAFGLPTALALARTFRAELFGLEPSDPRTAVFATLLLVATSLLAGYLPARRASRVDPLTALRD